jgi:hypothetical protein
LGFDPAFEIDPAEQSGEPAAKTAMLRFPDLS